MRTITVTIDADEWSALLEAWGDASIDWDEADTEPVDEKVIRPIQEALGGDRLREPPGT